MNREIERARMILAHTDMGSLPNDWTLDMIAEARIDDMMKLRDQVRDTCKRAEAAEAEIDRLQRLLVERSVAAAIRLLDVQSLQP